MATEIKVDKVDPSSGTTLQIGTSGDTITIPTGATFIITDGLGVAGGGTGLTSFTAGDVLYATGTTTLAKLAKGSDDDVLTLASGVPSWAAAAGGGKIGQVLQVEISDTFTTTSTSDVDITGMTLDITPTATTSKVLVLFTVWMGNGSDQSRSMLKLLRDSTQIFMGDTASARTQVSGFMYSNYDAVSHAEVSAGQYLDSPSSTSALTYKFTGHTSASTPTGTLCLNRSGNDSDAANKPRLASSLTLMEVLA